MHENAMVLEARNLAQSQGLAPWLDIDRPNFKAKVVAMPRREDVQTPPMNEQLIVEVVLEIASAGFDNYANY